MIHMCKPSRGCHKEHLGLQAKCRPWQAKENESVLSAFSHVTVSLHAHFTTQHL